MALTEPHLFLPGLPDSLGLNAAQDDACLAYSIFDQVGGASLSPFPPSHFLTCLLWMLSVLAGRPPPAVGCAPSCACHGHRLCPPVLVPPPTVPLLVPPVPLLQDPKCVNLADWYQAFAAVHEGAAQPGGSAGPAGKKRKAAVKKAKKAAKKDASGSRRVATEGEEEQEGQGEERRRVRELTARFSQATAELQYVGLIKPARRRRGDYVHRVVHMPAAE